MSPAVTDTTDTIQQVEQFSLVSRGFLIDTDILGWEGNNKLTCFNELMNLTLAVAGSVEEYSTHLEITVCYSAMTLFVEYSAI